MVKNINNGNIEYDEDDQGGEGQSGTSTGVEFHLDLLAGGKREDLLSAEELKRLLKVHPDVHYELVKKQKNERKMRKEIKEGKRPAANNNQYGQGGYGMGNDNAKAHPISKKAYFSGIDKQVIGIAAENTAETNLDRKNELENKLELKNRLQHKNTPKFNPTPRPQ